MALLWKAAAVVAMLATTDAAATKDDFANRGSIVFYLQDRDGSCLTTLGTFGSCDFASLWTYATRKEGHSLVSFLEPAADQMCLSRSSNKLGVSKCGKAGAKKWELAHDRGSGKFFVTAEDKKMCVVRTAQSAEVRRMKEKKKAFTGFPSHLHNSAGLQKCSQGGSLLQIVETSIHDQGFFLMASDGACFDGLSFRTCDPQNPNFYFGIGLKMVGGEAIRTMYKWHNPSKCLGKSGSDTKLVPCTDSGAKYWGLKDGKLSQNAGQLCVVRDLQNGAHMAKCSAAFESMTMTIPQVDSSASSKAVETSPRRPSSGRY